MTPTRVRLTLEQKRLLRTHHAAHSELTRRGLCEWAATAFCLSRPLAKSTLADTLKASAQKDDALSPSRKAAHGARFPQVEKELVAWIRRCEALRLAVVTGATIMHKA